MLKQVKPNGEYKEMEEEYDEAEAEDHITDQLAAVVDLAKTLSSSMFVGKAKGESLEALGATSVIVSTLVAPSTCVCADNLPPSTAALKPLPNTRSERRRRSSKEYVFACAS